jgi:hypothetical protein
MEQQVRQLVAKYPNIKIVSFEHNSEAYKNIKECSLQALDDSLAVFSSLAKGIHIVPGSFKVTSKIYNTDGRATNSLQQNKFSANTGRATFDEITQSATYGWKGQTRVGSSEVGYIDIYFSALFTYYGLSSLNNMVNIITSISSINSYSPATSFVDGGILYYYTYTYAYNPISSIGVISAEGQVASLSYVGTVSLSKTYTLVGGWTTLVSAVNSHLSEDYTVYSSTFPFLILN